MSQSFLRFLISNPDQVKANGKHFLVLAVSNNQVCVAEYDESVASRQATRAGFNSPLIASATRDNGEITENSVLNVKWWPVFDERFDNARTLWAEADSYVYQEITVEDTAQQIADKNAANLATFNAIKSKLN